MPVAASTPQIDEHRRRKRNGIHYTPPELAAFLASVVVRQLPELNTPLDVLDPACGTGALLSAFANALRQPSRQWLRLHGYETDAQAVEAASKTLSRIDLANLDLRVTNFLATSQTPSDPFVDVVIANPPYVRTQALGAAESQRLAKRFGLSGRVDLAHAFVHAITDVLRPGGVLGLLTSNRFLTVKSGADVRRLLRSEFEVREIFDLGDTKLFDAAVLPVIVVAVKKRDKTAFSCDSRTKFSRTYQSPDAVPAANRTEDLFKLFSDDTPRTDRHSPYQIERGELAPSPDLNAVWRLTCPSYEAWLDRVCTNQVCTFSDVAEIRVGIKTTADKVFVRDDWNSLPVMLRPEPQLLHPLLTHREVHRWRAKPASRHVLYPYLTDTGHRSPIPLDEFPAAAAYLRSHAAQLKGRQYVIDGGRQWYEIWVPHDPCAWMQPKIVFPDIAAEPRFCLDTSGAIVQGDCYWITLKEDTDPRWMAMMLAVANSSFITQFYDLVFHNKLYAGRRRFMTQYVKQFPLPALDSSIGRRIISATERLLRDQSLNSSTQQRLNGLIAQAFDVHEMKVKSSL